MSADTRPTRRGLRAYFQASRDPLNSVLLVLPLFVAYQIGILGTGGLRNGVDFMTDVILAAVAVVLGLFVGEVSEGTVLLGYIVFNLAVLAALGIAVWVLRHKGHFQPRLWPALLLESAVYAVFFGSAIRLMMAVFGFDGPLAIVDQAALPLAKGAQSFSPFQGLVTSVGAGLYEEIVFRVGLLGGTYAILTRWAKVTNVLAAAAAIVTSSLIFSAVHHLGSMGDAFTISVFVFRFFAGVLLSLIYSVRGFAVAVYTHAIYDVIVLVL